MNYSMEKDAVRLYAMDAVILMLRNLVPDRDTLRDWKRQKIKTGSMEHLTQVDPGREGNIQLQQEVDAMLYNLDASPGKTVLITDDLRYLHKVRRLKLAMRIAVAPYRKKKRYYQNGADLVINSLDELSVLGGGKIEPRFSQSLPNILTDLSKFRSFQGGRRPVFFFDYDGTLAPIVDDPAKAEIDDKMRDLLKSLSEIYYVAVVSGRDMNDIRSFIGLDSLIYAGSHGFRIKGPNGMYMENKEAMSLLAGLDSLEETLRKDLEKKIVGIEVERKMYAIAVHYRNAAPGTYKMVKKHISQLLQQYPDYKIGAGKKLYEIKPALDWHKGKAIEWILKELDMDSGNDYCPVYLGDDLTDEDAFRNLSDVGLSILVGDHGQPTAAHYHLKNVGQVRQFLHHLLHSYALDDI
jgi:trehalose-phosphatase